MTSRILIFLLILSLFLIGVSDRIQAEENPVINDTLEISLLTCGTGTAEVYQAYGHTGVRVQNKQQRTDIVYNYGMFDFYEEGFLWKFIRGKLLYFVATERFDDFMAEYRYFGRSVREQVLNLSPKQKADLVRDLETNALPENRYYLYDFIYNNCSTQPRDLIRMSMGEEFDYAELPSSGTETLREMIDRHMLYNEWLDFGIDLVLGMRLDRVADTETRMFLPAELMQVFDRTNLQEKPLVRSAEILYAGYAQKKPMLPDPTVVFWILFAAVLWLQVFVQNEKALYTVSSLLLIAAGIIGWVLLFFWFGTDHYMTKWNLNIFWAMPLYIPILLISPKRGKGFFIKLFRLINILLLIGWFLLPQQFHSAVVPIILMLIWALGIQLIRVSDKK